MGSLELETHLEKNTVLISVSVITVTHNHASYIGRCLDALVPEVERVGGEVIVVDNRSDDDSAAIARQYPSVKLHINKNRQGFSANNNFGMALANSPYLLLLNPDTEVQPGALETLTQFMNSHPTVGMCGAQLLFPDGTIQPSPRRFPTFASVLARRTPLRVFLRHSTLNQRHLMQDLDHSQIQAVDWLLGACMFIRREVLNTVGPLDEGYFLYVEDIDWAQRMWSSGWEIYYVPTAQILHHHIAISDKRLLSRYMLLHLQSMLRYARKHLIPKCPGISVSCSRDLAWRNAISSVDSNSNTY